MFNDIVSGFLGFFDNKVSVDVFANVIVEVYLSYGILYFSVAQIFVDFLICLYHGKV